MNDSHTRCERPWGHFDTFIENERCTVKILTVQKGEALSLQRHKKRDQLYIILDPIQIHYGPTQAELTIVDAVPYQTFYFPRGMLHRAVNNTENQVARYLEIATGKYDEEDIERLDDRYGRHIPCRAGSSQ